VGSADSHIIPDDSLPSLPEDLYHARIVHKVSQGRRGGFVGWSIGLVIEIVTSNKSVPQQENHPIIRAPLPDGINDEIPVQFVKVNLFKDRSLLSDRDFPGEDNFSSSCDGWQSVVQINEYDWTPSHSIAGLSFIFTEEDIRSRFFDDCHGMSNFFVVKCRLAWNEHVSIVPVQDV
jgi:hypothetical protein